LGLTIFSERSGPNQRSLSPHQSLNSFTVLLDAKLPPLIVGITGGSGTIYGVRLLQVLGQMKIEAHVVMSAAAKETLVLETARKVGEVESLASIAYRVDDIAAPPSSGSFRTRGMVIVPCSMKTLAGVASGFSDNLILRAAEVTLKERRPLVLVPRETPLTVIDIQNMLRAANAGAVILPAIPGFYARPRTIEDLVDHLVGKILDTLGIEHNLYHRWTGPNAPRR